MSTQITTAMVRQYSANVQLLSQQKGSRLRQAVRVESQTGLHGFYDQIGATAAVKRTTRHADTPQVDTPHARRRVTLAAYDWADLVDNLDDPTLLTDPSSKYAVNAAHAFGRSMDEAIITAYSGTAQTGETGGTSTSFTTANKIAHGSVGMTVAKLTSAKQLLDAAEVDADIPRYCVCNAQAIADLLALEKVTSSDYMTIKALVQGEIDTFLGFKFITTELLTVSSSDRTCLAFAQDGVLLAVGTDVITDVGPRRDKNMATQVYVGMSIGSTRMEEAKCVEIHTWEG